jgi:hypothetical protein
MDENITGFPENEIIIPVLDSRRLALGVAASRILFVPVASSREPATFPLTHDHLP